MVVALLRHVMKIRGADSINSLDYCLEQGMDVMALWAPPNSFILCFDESWQ